MGTDWHFLLILQEMEAAVIDGNGTETGHIIVTTIGGRNGQPKKVIVMTSNLGFLFSKFKVMTALCTIA